MRARQVGLWSAAAVVALGEVLAASLILHPKADATYRSYYIDRSSDCWPHDTPAAYALGTTLSFVAGKGQDFAPNKICGWFYPNDKGTWSYGRYSLLRFRFSPADAPLQLTLSAAAMVNAAHPVQRVAVSANGTALGPLDFGSTSAETKTLTVPAALAQTGAVELRFDYPDARPGNELGPNEDSHLRAVRMLTLKLGGE